MKFTLGDQLLHVDEPKIIYVVTYISPRGQAIRLGTHIMFPVGKLTHENGWRLIRDTYSENLATVQEIL